MGVADVSFYIYNGLALQRREVGSISMINHDGKEYIKKECVCVCIYIYIYIYKKLNQLGCMVIISIVNQLYFNKNIDQKKKKEL